MAQHVSTYIQSVAFSAENYSSSLDSRSSSLRFETRRQRASARHIVSIRPQLGYFWDLHVLDRLQAPLTHYHE